MQRYILITGSFLGFFSVLFGAFGAHLLEPHLIVIDRLDTYETAVKYQFYHVFLILILGLLYNHFNQSIINYAFFVCVSGIFLFSGSLYVLCLTNNSVWGIITPFGGILLIISWLLLFFSIKRSNT